MNRVWAKLSEECPSIKSRINGGVIRKSLVTMASDLGKSREEMEVLAGHMSHQPSAQLRYYNKSKRIQESVKATQNIMEMIEQESSQSDESTGEKETSVKKKNYGTELPISANEKK